MKHTRRVREPIQVYLTADERELLDSLAESTGLSRAEVLRRGIRSFASSVRAGSTPMMDFLDDLADAAWPEDIASRHDDHLARAYLNE